MSESLPMLDTESPWPVSTGTLGRTFATNASGPGDSEPTVTWTYDHDGGLVATPVVTRDGEVVLLDETGRLTLVSPEGERSWSVDLEVPHVEAFNSPAVWRRDGQTLVSVTHAAGVSFVEPGAGVVEEVPVEPPARFLCLREDGLVTWSREAVSLLNDAGEVVDEHRFAWRSDDIACPTVGPDGAVYFLENREYSPSWDAEDQYLEVARVTFDGGAERESVVNSHAHTADAVGSLCATEERLVWILDSWRLGTSAFGGESRELDLADLPGGDFPNRLLGGSGDRVLLQRQESGHPVYALVNEDFSTWPVEERVLGTVIDDVGTAYLVTDGHLQAVTGDGTEVWTTPADGVWLGAATGALLVADPGGVVTYLE